MNETTALKLTLETVKTSVGSCHKIGPLSFDFHGKPAYACIYVDGYLWPDQLDRTETGRKSLEDANRFVRCVNQHAQLLAALEATTRALVVIRRRLQTATGEAQQSAMAELERRIAQGESAIEKAREG
jgi:hypothetical protein